MFSRTESKSKYFPLSPIVRLIPERPFIPFAARLAAADYQVNVASQNVTFVKSNGIQKIGTFCGKMVLDFQRDIFLSYRLHHS